jgi:hypothetical protein
MTCSPWPPTRPRRRALRTRESGRDEVEVAPEGLAQEGVVHSWVERRHDEHGDAGIVKAPHDLADVALAAAEQVADARRQQADAGAGKVHVHGPPRHRPLHDGGELRLQLRVERGADAVVAAGERVLKLAGGVGEVGGLASEGGSARAQVSRGVRPAARGGERTLGAAREEEAARCGPEAAGEGGAAASTAPGCGSAGHLVLDALLQAVQALRKAVRHGVQVHAVDDVAAEVRQV